MFWSSIPTLGVSIIPFVLEGEPDLPLAETKGCISSCLCQREKLGSAEIMEQFCPCFQRGPRFHPVSLNSCWMYVLIATVDWPFRTFNSSSPPGRLKYLILFGHGGGNGKSVVISAAESGKHLCHYHHCLQPPPKVVPDQDHKDSIITNVLMHS